MSALNWEIRYQPSLAHVSTLQLDQFLGELANPGHHKNTRDLSHETPLHDILGDFYKISVTTTGIHEVQLPLQIKHQINALIPTRQALTPEFNEHSRMPDEINPDEYVLLNLFWEALDAEVEQGRSQNAGNMGTIPVFRVR